jgi:hypothetical protein
MRVKTFTGTHREAVDQQVNGWLAKNDVIVRKTNVALKPLRERGWDVVAGKTTTRRALAVAISVWYDEPRLRSPKSNPANWIFGPS